MQLETMYLFLASAGGAALIKLLDNVICHILQRRAKRLDNGERKKTEVEKQLDTIKQCLMVSMLDRIQYLGTCYIKAKEITLEDRRMLHMLHNAYKALGGNGDLDPLMEEVDELRLKL